jgi:hypothetical protein
VAASAEAAVSEGIDRCEERGSEGRDGREGEDRLARHLNSPVGFEAQCEPFASARLSRPPRAVFTGFVQLQRRLRPFTASNILAIEWIETGFLSGVV